MYSKLAVLLILLLVIFAGFAFSTFLVPASPPPQRGLATAVVQSVSLERPRQARQSLPVRLKIPSIGVDAGVEHAGLTPSGEVGVPAGPTGVAWFELGSRPGEAGSAVLSGHFGWKDNIPAVFDNLSTLQKGDKVYIEDENGGTTTFVVRKSRSYNPDADATEVFGSRDGKAHLNLITCEGVWNAISKSYSQRLVVFADAE